MNKVTAKLLCVLFMLFWQISPVLSQRQVTATPQRPSFSTNTSTTEAGWLEFEGGISLDEQAENAPIVLKLGLNERVEMFFGTTIIDAGRDFEVMTLGGRWRFVEIGGSGPSLAGQATVTSLRSDFLDQLDYSFLLILSHSTGEFALDLNAGLNIPDRGEETFLGIATLSRSLSSKLGGYVELLVNYDTGLEREVIIGSVGLGLNVTPKLVFDTAVNLNISNAQTDFQFLFGVTTLFSRLW